MHTNYEDWDRTEWKAMEEQWGEEQKDFQTQMDHGIEGAAEPPDSEYGRRISFYEQEKQQWGRNNQSREEKGMQEGVKKRRNAESLEGNRSREQKAHVIQGRVINYTSQATKTQEEDNRRDYQEEENKRYWEHQIRDRERIMQLEEAVEKSNRKNAELLGQMLGKERRRETRKRRVD